MQWRNVLSLEVVVPVADAKPGVTSVHQLHIVWGSQRACFARDGTPRCRSLGALSNATCLARDLLGAQQGSEAQVAGRAAKSSVTCLARNGAGHWACGSVKRVRSGHARSFSCRCSHSGEQPMPTGSLRQGRPFSWRLGCFLQLQFKVFLPFIIDLSSCSNNTRPQGPTWLRKLIPET